MSYTAKTTQAEALNHGVNFVPTDWVTPGKERTTSNTNVLSQMYSICRSMDLTSITVTITDEGGRKFEAEISFRDKTETIRRNG